MKVALSNPRRTWGGASSMTVLLAEGLTRRGHEVVVLSRRGGSQLETRLRGKVPLAPVLTGRDFPLPSIVRAAGVLRKEKPAVLISATSTDLRFTPPAARALGIPVIARREALFPLTYHNRFDRMLWRTLADHIVANSEATKAVLLGSAPWLRPENVTVIYNGIDIDRFRNPTAADLPIPPGAIAIGFIGRLAPEKGLPDLVAAWRRIAVEVPDAHLLLAGDGGERVALERQLADDARVHFLGYRTDVPALMKAFDILVLPSHSEAFGIAAAEGMAAGLPVIATRVGGLPEVIDHEVDGILVEPHAPAELADAVIGLVRDASRRQRIADAARATAHARFDQERVLDAYEELLARWKRR